MRPGRSGPRSTSAGPSIKEEPDEEEREARELETPASTPGHTPRDGEASVEPGAGGGSTQTPVEPLPVVDGMEGPLDHNRPWAANLSFPDLTKVASILRRTKPARYNSNGWIGPATKEQGMQCTLKHNIRFWVAHKDHSFVHRWDNALDDFTKSVFLFRGAERTFSIIQRDVDMRAALTIDAAELGDGDSFIILARSQKQRAADHTGGFPRVSTYRGEARPYGQSLRRPSASAEGRRTYNPNYRPGTSDKGYYSRQHSRGHSRDPSRDPRNRDVRPRRGYMDCPLQGSQLPVVESLDSEEPSAHIARKPPTPPPAPDRRKRTRSVSSDSSASSGSSGSGVSIPTGAKYFTPACNLAVLSKARRRTVHQGLQALRDHDKALRYLCNTVSEPVKGPAHTLVITSKPRAFQESGIRVIDVGLDAMKPWEAEGIRRTLQEVSPSLVVVAIEYQEPGLNHSEVVDEVIAHCECSGSDYLIADVADTERWGYFSVPMYPDIGHGDVSYVSNNSEIADAFEGWTGEGYPTMGPRSFWDLFSSDFLGWLINYANDHAAISLVATSYPVWDDGEIDDSEFPTFDSVENEDDVARMDPGEEAIQEDLELDEVQVPGLPRGEAERRAGWRKLPQRVRVAIRRLHRQFGHAPRKVLLNLLRAAKVDPQYLDGLRLLRCNECEENAPRRSAHSTSLPENYVFNHTLGIDLLEVTDATGTKFQVLNMICLGTCFQLAEIVRQGPGQASSAKCLEAIQRRWITWAGHPKALKCDRGLHNRGVLARYMAAHGVDVTHAPLETPEAIGRVERHGGIIKGMARKVISQTQPRGWLEMQQVLDETCLTKNSLLRQGGYSPAQWVLGRAPRELPSILSEDGHADLGAIQDSLDPESAFALQHMVRAEAKKAFVQLDTSKRVQRALLRNARAIPGDYQVGDVVTFRRTKAGKTSWSPASRVIGFEGRSKESVWLLCENIPVLASAQNLRPATDAEALAFNILHGNAIIPEEIVKDQQGFDDYREPAPTGDHDPAPDVTLEEGPSDGPMPSILEEDEEHPRSRSPPGVRNRGPNSSSGPRIRGSSGLGTSQSSRSRRLSIAEPEQERTPGGSRRPSYDVQDDLPEQLRQHFQHVRDAEATPPRIVSDQNTALSATQARPRAKFIAFMANRAANISKEEAKSLPGSLNYYDCSPAVQRKIDESRKKEWMKYESFQAAIPVTGKILKDLLDEGHVPLPSKWVDTVKNIHEQHLESFDPEFKSRMVACGNFEGECGVRTDSPTSDIETHAMVCAFAASEGVPVQGSDIKNAYFQALPIDRIVLMRQPRGGLPGVDPEAMLLVRVPVYGLQDSGRGFWKRVDKDAKDVGLNASRIFPAFYYHTTGSKVDLLLTTHVDDFLWASTPTGDEIMNRLLERFEIGRKEIKRLRFCGKQFDQSGKDIVIDVSDNTRRTTYIDIAKGRQSSDPITQGEERQLRSVVGSLSWIARQGRPDILYKVSYLQSKVKGATVAILKEANKCLEIALAGKDFCIRYKNGPFDFMDLGVLTASDASFAGAPGLRSQQGRIHFLVPRKQLTTPGNCVFDVALISFGSTTIKRVCRATLQAETYALQSAQESGDRIRALLAELYGQGSPGADWYDRSRRTVPHMMLTDCRSLSEHLNVEVPSRVQDKRLQIELNALRQALFEDDGTRSTEVFPGAGDQVVWTSTATMIADCLTKSMRPDFLIKVLTACQYQIERQSEKQLG